jgi:hypothetical protein
VPATLASITDGDTIRVDVEGRNEPVRLILIDTPETRAPNSPIECFGPEATRYLQWLLSLGGQLYLETDVSNHDRYDRLLRYVWLELDGEVYLVNAVMVHSGYAALSAYQPLRKHALARDWHAGTPRPGGSAHRTLHSGAPSRPATPARPAPSKTPTSSALAREPRRRLPANRLGDCSPARLA